MNGITRLQLSPTESNGESGREVEMLRGWRLALFNHLVYFGCGIFGSGSGLVGMYNIDDMTKSLAGLRYAWMCNDNEEI